MVIFDIDSVIIIRHRAIGRIRTYSVGSIKIEGYHSLVYGFGKKNPNSHRSEIIKTKRTKKDMFFFFFFHNLPVCDGGHHDLNSYYSINQNVQILKMCAIIEKHCIGCKLFW